MDLPHCSKRSVRPVIRLRTPRHTRFPHFRLCTSLTGVILETPCAHACGVLEINAHVLAHQSSYAHTLTGLISTDIFGNLLAAVSTLPGRSASLACYPPDIPHKQDVRLMVDKALPSYTSFHTLNQVPDEIPGAHIQTACPLCQKCIKDRARKLLASIHCGCLCICHLSALANR